MLISTNKYKYKWKIATRNSYLLFLLFFLLTWRDCLIFFATTWCSTGGFTVLTHFFELLPRTEKVDVICTMAKQQYVVLWNGTDKIIGRGRMCCGAWRQARSRSVAVFFSDWPWCRRAGRAGLVCAWRLCCGSRGWHRSGHSWSAGGSLRFDRFVCACGSRGRSRRGGWVVTR